MNKPPLFQFGEWLPDQPTLGLKGATVANNVLPDVNAYRPMPSLVPYTTAVGGRVLGGVFATDAAGNNYNYCGDASALYALTNQSFSLATRTNGAYTTLGDDVWEFVNWGNTIIGVNGFTDLPQQISLGSTTFADLSTGVKARHAAVMGDFLVLGNISDTAAHTNRVRWSAINNPGDFVQSPATLSDLQDLPTEGGPVQRLMAVERGGLIFQQLRVTRMTFVGSPLVFDMQPVLENIGLFASQAIAKFRNLIFFRSEDGFYSHDGSMLDPIGAGKVDRFFNADLHPSYRARVQCALDHLNKIVMWGYASNSTTGGNLDKLIIYSWAYKKWALVSGLNVELILSSVSTGVTLDNLDALFTDLDAIPVSLDSSQWQGGQIIISAYDNMHKLGRFNGSAMAATVTTGEFQLFSHQKAYITEVWPLALGLSANVTITLLNRNLLTSSASVGAVAMPINETGFAEPRTTARYFQIQMDVTGDFKQLLGATVVGTPAGER